MLQVSSRYFDGMEYKVILQETEPDLTLIPMRFNENLSHLNDNDLIQKVMEKFYRKNFENKFISEAVDIVEKSKNEMVELVKKYREMVADGESTVAKIKKEANITQGSVLELTDMIFDHEMRIMAMEALANEENEEETIPQPEEPTKETVNPTETVDENSEPAVPVDESTETTN